LRTTPESQQTTPAGTGQQNNLDSPDAAAEADIMEDVGIPLPAARLTAEQEITLAKTIEAGVIAGEARRRGGFGDATAGELILLEEAGAQALTRFVDANLRLVAMVARKEATRCGLAAGELFQEGCLGLLTAVMRFDHRKTVRFATYALYWIRAQIGVATANRSGELNLPAGHAGQIWRLRGSAAQLSQRLGRTVSDNDVAAATGHSRARVAEARGYRRPQSLEEAERNGIEVTDPNAADAFDQISRIDLPGQELFCELSLPQRQVVEYRYGFVDGDAHSYSDTARRLKVPISTVRRTEERALDVLRGVCPQQARALL
jgi:RNA polymerase primary sigma factor/RNA polymerase nonessential primary-like sigma factor